MKILSFDIVVSKTVFASFNRLTVYEIIQNSFCSEVSNIDEYTRLIQSSWESLNTNLKSIPRKSDIKFGGEIDGNSFYLIQKNTSLRDNDSNTFKVIVLSQNDEMRKIISIVIEKLINTLSKKYPWLVSVKPIYQNPITIYIHDTDTDDIVLGIEVLGKYQRKSRSRTYEKRSYFIFFLGLLSTVFGYYTESSFLISFGASSLFWVFLEWLISLSSKNNIVIEDIENVQLDKNIFSTEEEKNHPLETPSV